MELPKAFVDFLEFENAVFGTEHPIATYDTFLIRYGEYRFVVDKLSFVPGKLVLDLGCEANLFMLYVASKGCRVVGVDINPVMWVQVQRKKMTVEKALKKPLDVTFKKDDATRLSVEPNSVDTLIAISSIEHMFSKEGHGDQLAVESIARVLKPGGLAVITVPMSNGEPFHETAVGDKRFAGPYRLYTPETLQERLLSNPQLEIVDWSYLANTTPDPRFSNMHFHLWWGKLPAADRLKWAWAHPMLQAVFNPIISCEEGHQRVETLNTALVCFRKKS